MVVCKGTCQEMEIESNHLHFATIEDPVRLLILVYLCFTYVSLFVYFLPFMNKFFA